MRLLFKSSLNTQSWEELCNAVDCFGWSLCALQSDSFPVFGQDREKLGTHKCDVAFDQQHLSAKWVRFHDRYGEHLVLKI